MASHSDITDQLAKAITGYREAETNTAAEFWEDGIEVWLEAARDAGILKRETRLDWSLLDAARWP